MSTSTMSTSTVPARAGTVRTARGTAPRLTFARVARAEWIKTGTLRSSYWTVGSTLAFTLLFAAGVLLVIPLAPTAEVPDPAAVIIDNYGAAPALGVIGFAGMFAYALVAIYGVLIVSSERSSSGLIATTLAAVPRRTPVLLAKLLVSSVVGAVIGLVAGAASFLLVQPTLAGFGLGSNLFDLDTLQALAGGSVFLGLIAAMSTAIGSLFRSTAAAMGAVLGLLVLAPTILPIIPGIGGIVSEFLPSTAGMMLFQSAAQVGWQPIVTGGAVLLAWTAGAAVVGGVLFTRRDV
ncbi:ABC transporter permease subunit [Agromyces sp. NPDC049794]|uniref:ABC transporter permease subunit n=1 Tax=unclassified Agromyces TaxID=2639701 RepID=UPI0034036733